jgi:hypothetical protein
MSTAKLKRDKKKAKQIYSRMIQDEWRKIFKLPIKKRIPLAWRILRGK